MIRVVRKARDPAPGETMKNLFDQIREAAAQKRTKVPPGPVRALALGAISTEPEPSEQSDDRAFQR